MQGKIKIKNCTFECTIGVHAFERTQMQTIMVDIEVLSDFSKCVLSDSIEDTVDYTCLAKLPEEIAKKRHYKILEKYASDLVDQILHAFPKISWAKVIVKKPGAILSAAYAAVEWEKKRV